MTILFLTCRSVYFFFFSVVGVRAFQTRPLTSSSSFDYCVVGAGLSGSVIAERLATQTKSSVLIMEKRNHIGGNCYDFIHETGIRVNKYGAHLFHTNSDLVWNYINRWPTRVKWVSWFHRVKGMIDGHYVPIPVNAITANELLGMNITTEVEMEEWLKTVQIPCPNDKCSNAEEMAVSRVGKFLFKTIFEPYTIKQWGVKPSQLESLVTARIPVHNNFDERYFPDRYQALPDVGYTGFFEAMLDHPLINVILNKDFFSIEKDQLSNMCKKAIVFTGPIDLYFKDHQLGSLEYRSLNFVEEVFHTPGYYQPDSVVNYPSLDVPFTRIVEYKHFLHQQSDSTVIYKEISSSGGEPYYPFPNQENSRLYEKYQQLAIKEEAAGRVFFAGRLANYKYFNMDQAIENALNVFSKIRNLLPNTTQLTQLTPKQNTTLTNGQTNTALTNGQTNTTLTNGQTNTTLTNGQTNTKAFTILFDLGDAAAWAKKNVIKLAELSIASAVNLQMPLVVVTHESFPSLVALKKLTKSYPYFSVVTVPDSEIDKKRANWVLLVENLKLAFMRRNVGSNIVYVELDMIFMPGAGKAFENTFNQTFDVAFTYNLARGRYGSVNTGVIFNRVSSRTILLFEKMSKEIPKHATGGENQRAIDKFVPHLKWSEKYSLQMGNGTVAVLSLQYPGPLNYNTAGCCKLPPEIFVAHLKSLKKNFALSACCRDRSLQNHPNRQAWGESCVCSQKRAASQATCFPVNKTSAKKNWCTT